ncbi:hypothetical protein [Streptococcus sp. 2018162]|nr:hypothetical protein [Streptococcus sp. 2018162]MBY0730787.1 hypothetical protein [Streptococcus sp. 2018162]
MRGLKYSTNSDNIPHSLVAPHTGAWIEIANTGRDAKKEISRTPYGCVD